MSARLVLALAALLPALALGQTSMESAANWAGRTFGEPAVVGVHTLTRHDPSHGANDVNPGLYVITDKGWTAGTYYNSHFRQTWYAGYTTPEWFRVRLTASFNTGYNAWPTATLVPTVRLHTFDNGATLRLGGGPKIEEKGQSIQHLLVEWKLR